MLAERHPSFRLERHDSGDAFVGEISLGSDSGITTTIPVRIELSRSYPSVEPTAFDYTSRFDWCEDGHINGDGSCCLWLPPESRWRANESDGLLRFLDHVAEFFYKELVFEATGRWPGSFRRHRHDGYRDFIAEGLGVDVSRLTSFEPLLAGWRETDKYAMCPCGSGRAIRWCHEEAVANVISRVGRSLMRALIELWTEARRRDDASGASSSLDIPRRNI